jgi:tRNA1Val (adenine37-N6)-methyltransferase
MARHTDELDFDALLSKVSVLLSEKGSFSVVLPATASADFVALALGKGLHLSRQTWVHPRQELPAKRVLMAFVKHPCAQTEITHLSIETERHVYTPEFSELARDFYLAL